MPAVLETRTVAASFEMRDDTATGAPIVEGYAATFNVTYDLGAFQERVDPGAFTRTLSSQPDVRLLVDHEGQPLARTKSGTLELSPDATGLHVRATLDPSDPDVQRLLPKMRRGDLDQMSFAFRVPAGGDTWSGDFSLRTLREVSLAGGDVSVVTYPANPGTTVGVRSAGGQLFEVDPRWSLVDAMVREMRAGKELSAANAATLKKVLGLISTADDAVDAAQPLLAELLGVPNPDADDDTDPPGQANSLNVDMEQRRHVLLLASVPKRAPAR